MIYEKIQNLLDLAGNNPSEEEASSALAMARRLMLKHNIDENTFAKSHKQTIPVDYSTKRPIEREYFSILASAVKSQTTAAFVTYSDGTYVWAGRKDNVRVAEQLLKFLSQQVEELYKIHLPPGMTKSERAKYRRDFKRSCAFRIYQRSEELKHNTSKQSDSRALVVVETELEREVEDFLNSKGIRYVSSRKSINTSSRGGRAGFQAGNTASLQPKIK